MATAGIGNCMGKRGVRLLYYASRKHSELLNFVLNGGDEQKIDYRDKFGALPLFLANLELVSLSCDELSYTHWLRLH